jgi:DNA-binding GntR family transcriptional regulator
MTIKTRQRESIPADGAGEAGDRAAPARGLLKERAYDQLKGLILDGSLAPGTFLAERQLAARLGMSKTPVRSALERLESEGFISISPQQGAIIRDLSLGEVADQYEIRVALETVVARNLAGRLGGEQVARVRANLEAQRQNLGVGSVERGVALDEEFHALFCVFLGNREILRVMGQLGDKVHRVISRAFTINTSRMVSSYEEHRGIAEAIFDGDAALAARRIEEHLQYGKLALLVPNRA